MKNTIQKIFCVYLSWMMTFSLPVPAFSQEGDQQEDLRKRKTEVGGVTVEQTLRGKGPLAIAILDLEGRGISTLEAATLTDRMRSELVNTGGVTIVERSQMQEILSEQGFQQTGCTSDECAVEVGKLLGVSNMVTGSIGKIGASYTLDVRMFNVESGAVVKTVNKTYRGEIDGLITEIEKLSWEIVNLTPPKGRFEDQPSRVADRKISEQPKEEKKKSNTLLWVGLGLLAVGGGAAVALSSQTPQGPEIGEPPAFPNVP